MFLFLAACSQYSYGTITEGSAPARAARDPATITISERDSTAPYDTLGDINVTVNKTTVFNADPTRADVDNELRKRAAAMGADAVVLVRYGNAGISLISWGSLEGKGRAIVYRK